MRTTAALVIVLLGLTGCGNRAPESPAAASEPPAISAVVPGPDEELVALGTVLDDGEGPVLCLGGVAESYPPQCDGPALAEWEWPAGTAQDASGVRWGDYAVTGTFDGRVFTVTGEPVTSDQFDGEPLERVDSTDFATPCPEPEGGWVPPEPGRATEATLAEVTSLAEGSADVREVWIDQSPNPYDGTEDPVELERLNDPLLMVVNVRVAGDDERRAELEEELRSVWGGALCVSADEVDAATLATVEREIASRGDDIGLLSVVPGRDRLDVEVLYDDGTLQRALDAEHGEGLVRVLSAMRPVAEVYPDGGRGE